MTYIRLDLWRIYGAPLVFAIISMAGLGVALVGDGLFDVVGWTFLLAPLLAAAHYLFVGSRQPPD